MKQIIAKYGTPPCICGYGLRICIYICEYIWLCIHIYIYIYVIIDFYMSVISSNAPQPLSQPQLAPLLDAWLLAVNMAEARPTNTKG